MASTYSPSLRLELIGDGDQSGIWGQTTNNNLGYLLEQAVSGVITITMTNANYTMSNFNGVVDEARNQVLIVTGTNTAVRNLVAPLVEKTYVVQNNTTGGYAIQVIGSSGLGVTIPNGIAAYVYCDGTNFYNAISGSVGNYTVNGNLSVTGTTALTGALTASTAAFSGAISSVSPTFTGTVTVPNQTAGTSNTTAANTAFVTGAITTATGALGTMSTQNANAVAITGGTITGITDLTVADGGTGASTFTANSVVLGNGTSSLAGNLVAPSTANNVLVSNGTTWTSGTAPNTALGNSTQSIQFPSRSFGSSYTNSTGSTIFVNASCNSIFGTGYIQATVNGSEVAFQQGNCNGTCQAPSVGFPVPNGSSYLVNSNCSVRTWAELRT